jgi:hypothetical protein
MASFEARNALKLAMRILEMQNEQLKRGGRAEGKGQPRLIQDQFPTSYMPHVGRQVMAQGGEPSDVPPTVQMAQDIVQQPMPEMPMPTRRRAFQFNTPEEQARPIMEQHRDRGLQFPEEEGLFRLNAKLNRERSAAAGKPVAGNPVNPRTVIKAPKNSGLPDFVAGNINFDDWTNRHEQILSDNEIHDASKWYARVANTFDRYYPDDPAKARQAMRAWLVAQQNVSPAGAMQNVLLQKEQMARDVPEELWRAGGMPNPTQAARSVLRDQPIAGGVGQKIADFVDSAEGKDVRSWMANHPDGEAPFVIDVHSARDTGMVDQELINHLSRLGYDPKALGKLEIDLKGTPTEAAYENRAAFGRGLTQHLNDIGWKGRSDWRPEEIQAVGWMGMTKLTRNAEEDAESGLSRNLRRISFEADPGEGSPWAQKYGADFGGMNPDEKAAVTQKIADSAMRHASKLAGIDVHSLVHGTGAWEQYQNPAAVAQSLSTQEGADIASNVLGYLLNQTEVWHNRMKPMTSAPKGFGIDFVERGTKNLADRGYLADFWQKIMDADDTGLFRGFQPITLPSGEVGIRALVDKGGAGTRAKIEQAIDENGSIRRALEAMGLDIDVSGHEAEITKHRNDWKENPDGKGYMERLVNLLGPNSAARLTGIREQLERELEGHIAEVKARRGKEDRSQGRRQGGSVRDRDFGSHPAHGIPGIHIVGHNPVFTGEK